MKQIFILSSAAHSSYNSFASLLESDGWRVVAINSISPGALLWAAEARRQVQSSAVTCLAILEHFPLTGEELSEIHAFQKEGGSLLVAATSSSRTHDETQNEQARQEDVGNSTMNHLVAPFGIQFNSDCIVRPNLYRLFHPKEAKLEAHFVVNRGLANSMKKYSSLQSTSSPSIAIEKLLIGGRQKEGDKSGDVREDEEIASIIYPYGCSLRVEKRSSTAIMMVSPTCTIPAGRALCAFHVPAGLSQNSTDPPEAGRVVVLGAAALISDKYIHEEQNRALIRALLDFIQDKDFVINTSDARTASAAYSKKQLTSALGQLVDMPISCLENFEPLPADKSHLFDRRLFAIDGRMIPAIARAYKDLNVDSGPLTVVKPPLDASSLLVLGRQRPHLG